MFFLYFTILCLQTWYHDGYFLECPRYPYVKIFGNRTARENNIKFNIPRPP